MSENGTTMRTRYSAVLGTASSVIAHDGTQRSVGHVLIDLIVWAAGAAVVLGGILVLFWGLRAAADRLQRR